MAGLGRKVFNSGDILLASEVQGYLQDQAVMVFDDAATRATAIGTANFSEGMVTYTKDDDAIQVYDGSNFVPVGSEPGLVHIETVSDTAVASFSIGSDASPIFTSDYDNYKIYLSFVPSTNLDTQWRLRANTTDDTSSNYSYILQRVSSGTTTSSLTQNNTFGRFAQANSGLRHTVEFTLFGPALARQTNTLTFGLRCDTGGSGDVLIENYYNIHKVTSAFNGITFFTSTGNYTSIEASIYGLAKS